jgi:hypothetical protein
MKEDDMPEYVMLIADDMEKRAKMTDEEFAAALPKVFAWFDEQVRAGRVVENAGRRLDHAGAKTVRVDGGRVTVTDGPYAETKELIGGFAVLSVPDMDAAIALAKTWPGAATTLELRRVMAG